MDIKRIKRKTHNKTILTFVGLTVVVAIAVLFLKQPVSAKVKLADVWSSHVQRGDLIHFVEGFGILQSSHQRLITAQEQAVVEEILLKPGADVSADDIILRLSNPTLQQSLVSQRFEVERQRANLRQIKLYQQRELLALQGELASLNAQLKSSELELSAKIKLLGQGVVSQLELERAKLDAQQFQERFAIEQRRLEQLVLVHSEAQNIQNELILQNEGELQILERRVEQLAVRAGSHGVLKRLPVTLGQTVQPGNELALVGSVNELVALVDISQVHIGKVAIGQQTVIRVREHSLKGEVKRIEPGVNNGTTQVEIYLSEKLPSSVRPEMNVEAEITIGTLQNTLFVDTPIRVTANSQQRLFVMNRGDNTATLTDIQFGEKSGKYIQILGGVTASDEIILSDTSQWLHHQYIMLTQ